jgi:hypothetical protein
LASSPGWSRPIQRSSSSTPPFLEVRCSTMRSWSCSRRSRRDGRREARGCAARS